MNQSYKTKSKHGYSIKFSPYFEQRIACVSSQYYGIVGAGSLVILDIFPNEIRPLHVFEWSDGLFDLAWAENNENVLVTAGGDGSIQVWDMLQPQGPLKVLKEHTKEVNSVDWSQTRNEHLVLSASWDSTVKLWDIFRDKSLSTFLGHEHIVYNSSWSPHIPGCFSTASGDHTLRVWDTRNTEACSVLIRAHEAEILTCDWCKYDQNILFSGSVDGLIRGWDIRNPRYPSCEMRGHQYAVRRIRASPFNGNILASASYDFSVKVWDCDKQVCVETVQHHSEFVYGLDFSMHRQGMMADCGWDEWLHVYHCQAAF